jgi:hypothetical protein
VHASSRHRQPCADDAGACIKSLRDLGVFCKIFEAFRKASLLTLKPRKCIIVPLTVECSEANVAAIRMWLSEFLPDCTHFKILPTARYLGIYLGPLAGEQQGVAPLAKLKDRISDIHAQKLPCALAVSKFISKGVPVLGYVAQVVPPPRNFKSIELASILKVLGMATSSLTTDAAYDLAYWGWNRITRPVLYMRACAIRAACKTLSNYEHMHTELAKLAFVGLPVKRAMNNELIPPGWDSEALCTNLTHAIEGRITEIPAAKLLEFRKLVKIYRNERIKTKGCQAQVYKFLQSCLSDPWTELLPVKAAIISPASPPWSFPFNFQSTLLKIPNKLVKGCFCVF